MVIKVKAKATRKIFNNGDFYIWAFNPITPYPSELKLSKYFNFSVKGNGLSWISENKEYVIDIEELSTDKFGTSYKIVSCDSINCENLENLSIDESIEILTEITTESQAKNLLSAYSNFIWLALTKGVEAFDSSKIYNVGEYRLNAYVRELNIKYKYLNIMNKFKDYKLDITEAKQLVDEYDDENNIAKAFQDNPYKVLIECLGRSFTNSDKLIMPLREDLKVSEIRCAYLILSVLERNELDGSTRLNGNSLYYYILNEYNVPELEPLIVPTAKTNDLFYYDEESKDLSIRATYMAESNIVSFIEDKLQNSTVLDIDWQKYTTMEDFTMSDKQGMALKLFCEHNFMILAGFSGSGKTTSLKGIINLIEDNGMSYTLLAPTGKAAMRITESTHRPASTIHRKVLRDEFIDSDVIIVDETSMVDLPTFTMLIRAISNPNARIVITGDNAQLLPVGIGCVFNDLINSGKIPMVMLDQVFRYDTNGGLFVATNVRQGKTFFDNEIVKQHNNEYKICDNYKFIQTDNDNIFDTVLYEYNKILAKGIKANNILCLSPFNVGNEGTYKLNNAIQLEVNPPKPNEKYLTRDIDKITITFRVGDKVINKKNDYKALPLSSYEEIENSNGVLTSDDIPLTSVFNGQEGIVREVRDNVLVIQFDEELIVFDKGKINNLLLAYCISVHSSQGSEAQYVINIVSPTHKKMLNRNLLYVADTRAKKMQVDIGDMSTYNNALLVDGNTERFTWIKDLLDK